MSHWSSERNRSAWRGGYFVFVSLGILLIWNLSLSSESCAQQPTATMTSLTGTVLVNGQEQTRGAVLEAGDIIETLVGSQVVLELSDGSELELGEQTRLDVSILAQEPATEARTSQLKLLWGRMRALLSHDHQKEGSTFHVETPNALVGVKFSHPDIEVFYDPDKQESTAVAHTVELLVTNLLTGETQLIPVGATVLITATGIKIIAGMTASAGSFSLGSGSVAAIGAGAAAVVGAGIAVAAENTDSTNQNDTSESSLAGIWSLSASGVSQGCTEHTPCQTDPPYLCGTDACGSFVMGHPEIHVSQAGTRLSASEGDAFQLDGTVTGSAISFTIKGTDISPGIGPATTTYTGTKDDSVITGNFSGSASWTIPDGQEETATWQGNFTVHLEEER